MHRIRFEKTGRAVWMSHLDLMRLMQRAFRRAGVVLHHSQGFTPHAYVSMLLPLSVGMESVCELMEYELDGELAVTPEALNAVLPEGVRVLEVYESTRKGPVSCAACARCSRWNMTVPCRSLPRSQPCWSSRSSWSKSARSAAWPRRTSAPCCTPIMWRLRRARCC